MLFIWGSKPRLVTVARGDFFCPTCKTQSHYSQEQIKRYFTFFFIPLFPTRTLGEYISCQNCHAEFQREVLSLTREQIERATAPWACSACGNHNSPTEKTCLACGAVRRQSPPCLPSSATPDAPGLDPLTIITTPPTLGGGLRRSLGCLPILLIVVAGMFVLPLISLVLTPFFHHSTSTSAKSTPPTGQEAFEEASRSIGSNSDGVGHGNSPDAQELAARLSKLLAILGKKIPHMDDTETLDSTHGDFIVYCQLNKDSCVFLVHVPNLRHYTSDSKLEIARLCYVTAWAALKGSEAEARIRKVAVATRGAVLYDTALLGRFPAPMDTSALDDLVNLPTEASDVPGLYPFFAPETATEKAASETSATPTPSPASPGEDTPKTPAPPLATPPPLPAATPPPPPTAAPTPPETPSASTSKTTPASLATSTTPPVSTSPPTPATPPALAALATPTNRRPPADLNRPLPSWVPIYPGLPRPPHGSSREDDGLVKGRANFDTTDPLDKVKTFYEDNLKADGFEIAEATPTGRLFEKADITAKKDGGKQTLRAEFVQMKARTIVTLTYEGPQNSEGLPAKSP